MHYDEKVKQRKEQYKDIEKLKYLEAQSTRKHNLMMLRQKSTFEEQVDEKRKRWEKVRKRMVRGESVGSVGCISSWSGRAPEVEQIIPLE